MRTNVAIIGAGPAGLTLSRLLHKRGIDNIIIERFSRDHVEKRVRAGHLEPSTVNILMQANIGERIITQGLRHAGVTFHYEGASRRLDLKALTGRQVTIFGQNEICRDLIAGRLEEGGAILFDSTELALTGIHDKPAIELRHGNEGLTIKCDFIAGCDGFHGVCRKSMSKIISTHQLTYPYSWIGILARSVPVAQELIYAPHERGLALCSMRSQEVVRHYLQISSEDSIESWPDTRIWDELRRRLSGREADVVEGQIFEKQIFPLRSFVAEPMHWGKLFLAGDAAHIVPPSAAKGLNMAVADANALAHAFAHYYEQGDPSRLTSYSDDAKSRIWEGQRFSQWMTKLLHHNPTNTDFDRYTQLAELNRLFYSEVAAKNFADAYVGSENT